MAELVERYCGGVEEDSKNRRRSRPLTWTRICWCHRRKFSQLSLKVKGVEKVWGCVEELKVDEEEVVWAEAKEEEKDIVKENFHKLMILCERYEWIERERAREKLKKEIYLYYVNIISYKKDIYTKEKMVT